MATGYWRIRTGKEGNFELFDHLPIESARSSFTVKITIPGATTAEVLLDGADQAALNAKNIGTYALAAPATGTLLVEPGDVTAETGSTFRDGVYRFEISYAAGGTTYSFDERILFVPVIDTCISTKLDAYLAAMCDKCTTHDKLKTLQELVSIRQGAQLDINAARYSAADKKVTLMSNICTGASCDCVCGC
jgi:hypothetical protein